MRKVPEGTTHLDTVDGGCRAIKVFDGEVYRHNYYAWSPTQIPVSEVVLDNHYIEVAAHYGIE